MSDMPIHLILAVAGFVISALLAVAGWLIAILLHMIMREIGELKKRDDSLAKAIDNLREGTVGRAEHHNALDNIRELINGLRSEVQSLVRQMLSRGST